MHKNCIIFKPKVNLHFSLNINALKIIIHALVFISGWMDGCMYVYMCVVVMTTGPWY